MVASYRQGHEAAEGGGPGGGRAREPLSEAARAVLGCGELQVQRHAEEKRLGLPWLQRPRADAQERQDRARRRDWEFRIRPSGGHHGPVGRGQDDLHERAMREGHLRHHDGASLCQRRGEGHPGPQAGHWLRAAGRHRAREPHGQRADQLLRAPPRARRDHAPARPEHHRGRPQRHADRPHPQQHRGRRHGAGHQRRPAEAREHRPGAGGLPLPPLPG
mmetsp:Transcript_117988/g.313928  ORF Transcript_117988/g.313928 Transcript_117988/m.313928 type:complete len:218 (+) Transcript_117988:309-962(+)